MLTYRVGSGNMSNYYMKSDNVPQMQQGLAGYYATPSSDISSHAIPDHRMHEVISSRLGIDSQRPLTADELGHLLSGKRTDGAQIPDKQKGKNAFIDLTFSAPKSFSVALVLAPTQDERDKLESAYKDAVTWIMDHIESEIGTASIGRTAGNRARNRESAHIAIIKVEHYTARGTDKLPLRENTELIPTGRGDPQRHTHVLIPNIAVTSAGRATALYQEGLQQNIKTWGSLFQARLGTNLAALGVHTELDARPDLISNERMLRLTDVPPHVNTMYSKHKLHAEQSAKDLARDMGVDFETLSDTDRIQWMRRGAKTTRQAKDTEGGEYESWLQQAKDAGYHHRSVLRPDEIKPLRPRLERQREAFKLAKQMLAEHLVKRHVLEGSIPRVVTAKAFIETGIEQASEVNVITAAMRSEGVIQDGVKTALHWAPEHGKRYSRVSTQLSVEMEQEAIELLRAASEDKSVALSPDAIARAVAKVSAQDGLDFTTEHGLKQRAFIDKLASQGRVAFGLGVAGSGKSAALRVPIEAWLEQGREVYGITLAWRQTQGLKDAGVGRQKRRWVRNADVLLGAGVADERTFAIDPFIRGVTKGTIRPDRNSTVIIDEVALVGTRQMLEIARLRAKHGFQLVAIGDDMQYNPIDAGSTLDLARRALGVENVPELLSSTRQLAFRDRETASMWREGRAAEALERKDQDGTLRIVPGGYAEAVAATVDLWAERQRTNAGLPGYTLGISVPTNADSRAIGAEILSRRRRAGEVSHRDLLSLDACDQNGQAYSLTVAPGVKLRLFDRVRGQDSNGRWAIAGDNGTVVEMISHSRTGMTVRKPSGLTTTIAWDALRQSGGPIRLSYGDAVTGNARQSDTLTDHITSMPSGSSGVNGFGIYTMDSRSRQTGWVVTSQGAEKQQAEERRPLGDPRNHETDPQLVKAAILANMAKNLGQQPKKTLAVDFLKQSPGLQSGQIEAGIAPWMPGAAQAQVEAPKPVRTTPVFPAEPPKTTIELMAEVVARGDVRYERAVDQLLEYWEVDHPRPTREQAIAAAQSGVDDPYHEWDEARYQAECEIDHKLDVLVDKASNGGVNILSQAQRDSARVQTAAIDNAQQIAQQQQRDIHKDHHL